MEARFWTDAWPWLAFAYGLGSIPFGLVLARIFARTDVRTLGSGNIGATNVARVVGKKLGALTLLLDALKAAVPVWLAPYFWVALRGEATPAAEVAWLQACTGLCAFVGHCYPVWLRFRGGKGVASGVGFALAFAPTAAVAGLAVFALTYALARVVSVGSLLGALTVLGTWPWLGPADAPGWPLVAMFVILIWRHRTNLQRLWRRQELKV